jgi:thiamine pyrophosphokinase
MSTFVILLGGHLTPTGRLRRQIEDARFIAADRGIIHAEALGVTPELWMGDFDSAPEEFPDRFNSVERAIYPEDKDLTDGEIAADRAIELGATKLVLAGAFGGDRTDHEILHFTAAFALRSRVSEVILTSGIEEALPLVAGDELRADYPPGTLFSVLALSDLKGLTLRGAKWPLENRDVEFGSSLILSNKIKDNLSVRFRSGRALLYINFQPS